MKLAIAATSLLLAAPALAGGSASPKPPAAPTVDFSGVPESAAKRGPENNGNPHPVLARLVTEHTALVAGQKTRIGIALEQTEEWHTYWRSPGDIGLPTEITWGGLPDEVEAPAYAFPVPQRFDQSGQVSFGYEDQAFFFTEITVPEDAKVGDLTLTADVSWLVCKTACIPGEVHLELPFAVAAAGSEPATTVFAPLFDHYAKQHPVDPLSIKGMAAEWAFHQSGILPNDRLEFALHLAPTDGPLDIDASHLWPTFTSILTDFMFLDEGYPKIAKTEAGGVVVVIKGETFEPDPLPEDDRIGGLVQIPVDGKLVAAEITAKIPWVAEGTEVEKGNSPLFALADASAAPPTEGPKDGGDMVAATDAAPAAPAAAEAGLIQTLIAAFFGGLILNIMPCVLPVLALKLYSLVEQTEITPAEQKTAGLGYTAGVLVSFWALALLIVFSRSLLGVEVSWGGWMQFPEYIAAMATVCFAFGLSLLGVFEIPAFGSNAANDMGSKEGLAGYFFTGVFATLVATPCTAPMMGGAVAYAFAAPTYILFLIFTLLGLGLAFPFLVIAFVPALYRFLPQPGGWMETFKQLMGFSMIAVTVWLCDSLFAQIGSDNGNGFLFFLMFVGIASWVFGHWGGVAATRRDQAIAFAVAMVLSAGSGWYFLDMSFPEDECAPAEVAAVDHDADWDHIPWQPFSDKAVADLSGQPVFIDFTADWCLTCKVNEKTILDTSSVKTAMKDHGVVPLVGDWTRRDDMITAWLKKYGRAGVPMYLVIPADRSKEPILLPEVITTGMVIDAIEKAS